MENNIIINYYNYKYISILICVRKCFKIYYEFCYLYRINCYRDKLDKNMSIYFIEVGYGWLKKMFDNVIYFLGYFWCVF